ncbi:MAG: sporulation protein [Methanomicrobiales archaeon]|nr:sporulation protein [Methanomicrobiales archaeon]
MGAEELLQIMLERLERIIEADTILGAPIDMGDKVVLPVAGIGFGFGVGAAGDPVKGGNGSGGGGGAGITPVAVIVAHKDVRGPDGIQVLSLQKQGGWPEIIGAMAESLPTIIATFKTACGNSEKKKGESKVEME